MKTPSCVKSLALIVALALLAPGLRAQDYCWKSSYVRGIGSIPSECGFNQEKQGLLCYPACAAGFTGRANVCWQDCPSTFNDDGAFCRKPAAYGRGAGHAWQAADGFSSAGMLARCQSAEGRACEMWGAMAYPTCRDGFYAFGANVCSPVCTAGMADMGVSCAKKTTVRDTIEASCGTGYVYDTGLCYAQCKGGYNGVGPVCWGTCPSNLPYACGAGCAKDIDTCATNTNDQVLSVVSTLSDIALTVATFGVGTAAKKAVEQGTKVAFNRAAQTMTRNMTKATVKETLVNAAKKTGKEMADTAKETISDAIQNYEIQVVTQTAAGAEVPDFNWADLDPTGIAGIVTAYNHPVCAAPAAGAANEALSATIPAVPAAPPASAWTQVPGAAGDVAVTASGTAWVIAKTNGSNAAIFRMKAGEASWTLMTGLAVRVAAGGDTVVVVNAAGEIYRWTGAAWQGLPGYAVDAAVDAVGNIFVIGKSGSVWEMKLGQSVWTALPSITAYFTASAPSKISAAGSERVSIVAGTTGYAWAGPDAAQVPWVAGGFGGSDIATRSDGSTVWVAATMVQHSTTGNLGEPGLTQLAAVAAGGRGEIWVVASDGRIFKKQ